MGAVICLGGLVVGEEKELELEMKKGKQLEAVLKSWTEFINLTLHENTNKKVTKSFLTN